MVKNSKDKKSFAADNVTLTNAPNDEEYTVNTDTSSRNPLKSNEYYPGDSVDQHKEIEEANLNLAKEELQQQNENN